MTLARDLAQQNPESYNKLESILCSSENALHERFRALFTLKNIGDDASVDIIAKGFSQQLI